MDGEKSGPAPIRQLRDAVKSGAEKILNPETLANFGGIRADAPVLVILAAGKGTRFGRDPKCIQLVHGTPLARHSIDAFRRLQSSPVVCVVGYRHEEVSGALGSDNTYVLSDDPTGGTALAAFEALMTPGLLEANPPLIITMGDRIVPSSVFRRLWETHHAGRREADLTFLTAQYEPPRNRGKGRVLRGENERVIRIIEEKDIAAEPDEARRTALLDLTEGNCPLYVVRAATLMRYLQDLTNANAQGQYYLTDIIEAISRERGEIRTITTTITDPEYDLLCSDVTRPDDLALLEGILASTGRLPFPEEQEIEELACRIQADRSPEQVTSIARQLDELRTLAHTEQIDLKPDRPVGIGISGGRLRIAFMHPDMIRFFGPAWQMPIGAGTASGSEQIVLLAQQANNRLIHSVPRKSRIPRGCQFRFIRQSGDVSRRDRLGPARLRDIRNPHERVAAAIAGVLQRQGDRTAPRQGASAATAFVLGEQQHATTVFSHRQRHRIHADAAKRNSRRKDQATSGA